MPPRRAVKRKATEDDSDAEEEVKVVKKKTKTTTTLIAVVPQFINKALPETIEFPPRADGIVRLATWNVAGLAASQKKGFKRYVDAEDPDLLVLTETKVNNEPVDLALKARFPHWYWSISATKGYAGTAILSKHKPLSVSMTLPGHPDAESVKGRIITLEFENSYVVGTYVVNAGQELKVPISAPWSKRKNGTFISRPTSATSTARNQSFGWGISTSHQQNWANLSNGKKNWNKTAGYTEAETSAFRNILEPPPIAVVEAGTNPNPPPNKFVDIWRQLHPDERQYTYFSYRFNCRVKGIGWRIDNMVLSERITSRVKMCEIRSEIYGASDHCPLVIEIEGAL
ncbi:DNA-(apurinic or apyrimidinic site) lyase [Mycena chlorophos]|uniref:DNA-(Apurinic or apyrimidinic site) lyase n=1 Tax=Mycena chlorophos TaxID=658473 RepID=A0A8H6WMS8_MYCCL|nr:DNA-(apurinic or apyrimidinic site) lyase [Mycena chlorophos]